MNAIRALRERAEVTQAGLAEAGGTSQPTISAYEAHNRSPTLETVERLALSVGFEATVEYHPPLTREDRRSLALHRAIARHLAEEPERVLAQARGTLARMTRRGAVSSRCLQEWKVVLERPLPALLPLLSDRDPWAREMRHVTPFAGILSAKERADVYRTFAAEERRTS